MKTSMLLLFVAFVFAPATGLPQSVDAARRLTDAITAMDVEHHWPAGQHVNWETGVPDGRPEMSEGHHTHCSAFVAALAKNLGIYILRPPEHSQVLLANAQYDWLSSSDAKGWQSVNGPVAAQQRANGGAFVVAVYKSHRDDTPGHIAVVRPSNKRTSLVLAEGPQIAQAGSRNYSSTSLRNGFAGHPAAWGKNEVRYFAHPMP